MSNPGEELSFDTIDEIKLYGKCPAILRNLSLHIGDYCADEARVVCLSSRSDKPYVRVDGPSETWCAGIVEKTKTFCRNNRVWHSYVHPFAIWALSIIAINMLVQVLINMNQFRYPTITMITLAIFSAITGYIFFCFGRVFPPISIVLNLKERWVKKYATELTIGAAIISALAALYTAIKG